MQTPSKKLSNPDKLPWQTEKVIKIFSVGRGRAGAEEGKRRAAFTLYSSAGLWQVQFKCGGKGVTEPIQLF